MSIFTAETLAAHFLGAILEIEHEQHEALEKAAKLVEKDAKARIGHYQDAVGPLPAWEELAQSTKDTREHLGFEPDDPLLRTGGMRDSIDHEVVGDHATVGATAPQAKFIEMGTSEMPQRSFLAAAAYSKEEEIGELIGEAVFKAI